jgi:hypothetical protein
LIMTLVNLVITDLVTSIKLTDRFRTSSSICSYDPNVRLLLLLASLWPLTSPY